MVAVHSGGWSNDNLTNFQVWPTITGVTDLGRFGVQLFFLLSGWLIESIYGAKPGRWKSFFARRAARIYPLWLAFLLVGFVLPYLGMSSGVEKALSARGLGGDPTSTFVLVLATVTFTLWLSPALWNTVIPGGWSIQTEVAHYLIYPLLHRLRINGLLVFLIAVRISATILYYWGQTVPNSPFESLVNAWMRLGLHDSMIFFIVGIVICRWRRDGIAWDKKSKVLLFYFLLTLVESPVPFGDVLQKFGFIIFAFGAAFAISPLKGLSSALARIGKYSYFVYFCHFVVLEVTVRLLKTTGIFGFFDSSPLRASLLPLALFASALGVSMLLGPISWRLLEQPAIRHSRKY